MTMQHLRSLRFLAFTFLLNHKPQNTCSFPDFRPAMSSALQAMKFTVTINHGWVHLSTICSQKMLQTCIQTHSSMGNYYCKFRGLPALRSISTCTFFVRNFFETKFFRYQISRSAFPLNKFISDICFCVLCFSIQRAIFSTAFWLAVLPDFARNK